MESSRRTFTLITDFGLRDYFVASMKGVILTINPGASFVDISHLIPPQDIRSGAFTLSQAYPYFPLGTIHLAIVDPGVGTARKAVLAAAGGYYFVAPDNGILSYVLASEDGAEVYEITEDHYFRKPVCPTFHGRDIFAPVAAWVSRDIPLRQFGSLLNNPVKFEIPTLKRVRDSLIQATVLAVDHFGNLVTNLRAEDLPVFCDAEAHTCKILAAQREISSFRTTFGEGSPGELMVIPGSTGYLEIVKRDGSAANTLSLAPGAPIGVVLG